MATKPGENINQLQKLYRIVTPSDLIGRYKLEKIGAKDADEDAMGKLLNVFINTADDTGVSGLLKYSEIKEQLESLQLKSQQKEELKKYVNLHEKDSIESVLGSNANKASSTELRVISLKTPMLGLSLRDVNKVGTFLNAVPSIELSRCVPRLEIQFETAFTNAAERTAAELSSQAPTLLKYLNGDAKQYGAADRAMADASTRGSTTEVSRMVSGMELFTTPQTLVSPDSTLLARQTPVLDRFSSLMSIDSLEITAVPAGGTFSNKTARLNLILHDRSRLHEVASLIKPDAYSQTTVSLTYGWSHPDTTGENPVADLINSIGVSNEKYNIYNSSFSFGQGGGVRITLQLSMKGTNELRVVRIADSEKFFNLNVQLEALSRAIRDAQQKFSGLTKPDYVQEDVRVYQIIDAAANNGELVENYTIKDKDKLRKLIKQLQDSPANKGNTAVLQDLKTFMTNMESFLDGAQARNELLDRDAKKNNKMARVDDVLGKRFANMIGHQEDGTFSAAKDPYLDETAEYWSQGFMAREKSQIENEISGKSKEPRKFVSLAKLLLTYVGIPLQAMGTVDEVQFVYYPFNSEAGYARNTSLASFPVETQYFRDVMADYAKRKRNANITIAEFIQLLATTVLSDVRHPAYGMREIYANRDPSKPNQAPALLPGKNVENVSNEIAKKFGGVFRKPVVEIQIECRGGRPLKQGELPSDKEGDRIIRIHIYDKLSSAYEPTLKVLEAQQGLEKLKTERDTVAFNNLKEIANQIGLNLNDKKFRSYEDLKRFISQVTPVLNYGANSGGIIAATVQSMQNSDLATVNMQRAMGQPYNSEPNSSSVSAIPLRIQPSQLDITLFGCPLLNLAQQFFVDFSTGTTVDDLYTLTHLSHTIAAGKFESTAKLTPMNAYGAYESVSSKITSLKETIDELLKKTNPMKTWG
jgi:hypothetical protein